MNSHMQWKSPVRGICFVAQSRKGHTQNSHIVVPLAPGVVRAPSRRLPVP